MHSTAVAHGLPAVVGTRFRQYVHSSISRIETDDSSDIRRNEFVAVKPSSHDEKDAGRSPNANVSRTLPAAA